MDSTSDLDDYNSLRVMAETLTLRGTLKGHEGWVTAIASPMNQPNSDILLSASRDKTVILWKLTRDEVRGVIRPVVLCETWSSASIPYHQTKQTRDEVSGEVVLSGGGREKKRRFLSQLEQLQLFRRRCTRFSFPLAVYKLAPFGVRVTDLFFLSFFLSLSLLC